MVTSQPIRVLHCSPTWFSPESILGGGERWVDNVMRALSFGAPELQQAMLALGTQDEVALRGRALLRIVANERASGSAMDAVSSAIWDEIRSFDVIHVHQMLTDFGAYACCVAASMRKTIIGTDLGGGGNPIMLQGGLDLLTGIVSISDYADRLVKPNCRAPSIVMIGPIDTEEFIPAARPPVRPAVICVGRIMPHKGIDRIIRAIPVDLKLRVVGPVCHGAYRNLLGELAEGKDVEFIHNASDIELVRLYQQSTLFTQGSCTRDIYGNTVSKTELMGLTTLEAMSCGLAAIVSADGGSLPELVSDSTFGRVFSSPSELEDLLRLHQSGAWPEAGAGTAARAHVVRAHGLAAYGRRLAGFYGEMHARASENALCAS
jgi:glycosyltransferase involved in cell wall biosynthesis